MHTLYYITSELSDLYMTMYEADPNAQADPNADPNAQADPNADPNAQADPNADPNAQADPNADPNAQADPKSDELKKYLLFSKIRELSHYLDLYVVNADVVSDDAKNLVKFIGVVIDFYNIFDYESLMQLTSDIMKSADTIIKQRQKGEKIK